MIQIGDNLKRLRAQKGLTQEQLAEVFHVSAQAVSRWENDQAYPDVGMLPGLAMYFGVSVDEILGMDGIRKEERLYAAVSRAYTLARGGELDRAIEWIEENLKIYPDDSSLLMALSETLARKKKDEEAMKKAIAVSRRVLGKNEISMKARSTVMVNLMFLYMRAGEADQAKNLIRQLPHIWESREMVMPEACGEEAYKEELKRAVRKALSFLCMKIEGCENRVIGETPEYVQLGVEFERGMSDEEMGRKILEFLRD